jgi:SAM-dependent methyltransferase
MFKQLSNMGQRPKPFEFNTTELLWNDPYISKQMLDCHLNENLDAASRRKSFIDSSMQWITTHFSVGTQASVCDLGCGPGLYTLRLAQNGARVCGVDFSERSIAYARAAAAAAGLEIDYMQANYLEFETRNKFDLVSMIYCDFCVLDPDQRIAMLNKVRGLLNPGGVFLFDLCQGSALQRKTEGIHLLHSLHDGFWSAEEYYEFLNVFLYLQEQVSLDQYTIVQAERTWQVFNWLQYYSLSSIEGLLHQCGLVIAEKFADVCGADYAPKGDEFTLVVRSE